MFNCRMEKVYYIRARLITIEYAIGSALNIRLLHVLYCLKIIIPYLAKSTIFKYVEKLMKTTEKYNKFRCTKRNIFNE